MAPWYRPVLISVGVALGLFFLVFLLAALPKSAAIPLAAILLLLVSVGTAVLTFRMMQKRGGGSRAPQTSRPPTRAPRQPPQPQTPKPFQSKKPGPPPKPPPKPSKKPVEPKDEPVEVEPTEEPKTKIIEKTKVVDVVDEEKTEAKRKEIEEMDDLDVLEKGKRKELEEQLERDLQAVKEAHAKALAERDALQKQLQEDEEREEKQRREKMGEISEASPNVKALVRTIMEINIQLSPDDPKIRKTYEVGRPEPLNDEEIKDLSKMVTEKEIMEFLFRPPSEEKLKILDFYRRYRDGPSFLIGQIFGGNKKKKQKLPALPSLEAELNKIRERHRQVVREIAKGERVKLLQKMEPVKKKVKITTRVEVKVKEKKKIKEKKKADVEKADRYKDDIEKSDKEEESSEEEEGSATDSD
jgi:hypothetical protein